jgi:hypothetical protein
MPACLPVDTTRLALKEVAVVEQCGRSDQVFLERPAPCVNVSGEDQSAKETCMGLWQPDLCSVTWGVHGDHPCYVIEYIGRKPLNMGRYAWCGTCILPSTVLPSTTPCGMCAGGTGGARPGTRPAVQGLYQGPCMA